MWVPTDLERKRSYSKEWKRRNKARVKAYRATYHAQNHDPAKKAAYDKKRYYENPDEMRSRQANLRKEQPEKVRAYDSKKYSKLRVSVLTGYGGKCVCCGLADMDVLTLDHVHGDGAAHRKEVGSSGVYRWAVKNGFPETLRCLCFNCNLSAYRNERTCKIDHRSHR